MSAGATVVPPNDVDGSHTVGQWEFHYNGWKLGDSVKKTDPAYKKLHRGVSCDDMFPKERAGSLDANLLKKMGLPTL